MLSRALLPALAIIGIGGGAFLAARGQQATETAQPVVPPSSSPYQTTICGSGMIEACSDNIRVGAPSPGMVEEIYVFAGQEVEKGQPLFRLDTRTVQAELNLAAAECEVAGARVAEAEASCRECEGQFALTERIQDSRAISLEERDRRRHAVDLAKARVQTAKAEARRMEAKVALLAVELRRLTVCAPIQGVILQKNIHPGEYVLAGEDGTKLLLLGVANPMRVRVDIDETDAWRFDSAGNAVGVLRGNPSIQIPLTFLGYEPYVIPKRSLTGQLRERVDTRVLQALYRFDPSGLPVYIGGQMDVYIQARPSEIDDNSSGK